MKKRCSALSWGAAKGEHRKKLVIINRRIIMINLMKIASFNRNINIAGLKSKLLPKNLYSVTKESIIDQIYSSENLLQPLFAKEANSSLS
jgi:hypothetical protein